MKKAIVLLIAATLTLSVLTGCSRNDEKIVEDTQTSEVNEEESSESVVSDETSGTESSEITPYGKLVEVSGKKMNTYTVGEGEKRIVWIPGYGDIAPGLSYTKMLEELAPHYRVTVIEPFGYGLSDVIGTERTIENIVSEIHEAVAQVVDGEKYILMGHSISGVYGMKYVNDYRDEVSGFIGLDSSTPNMYDSVSIGVDKPTLDMIEDIPEVSDEINKQQRLIAEKMISNEDVLNEEELINDNLQKSKEYPFPKDLPVLFLLASESVESRTLYPGEDKDWVKLHTDLTEGLEYTDTIVVEGDHIFYKKAYKELTEKINEFVKNMPQ